MPSAPEPGGLPGIQRPAAASTVVSRGAVVIPRLVSATGFFQRLLGLMGKPPPGYALLLSPCRSIHTCFMRFPIDVIFLDRNLTIVKISRRLPPWRLALGTPSATSVIEIPAGNPLIDSLATGSTLQLCPLSPLPHP